LIALRRKVVKAIDSAHGFSKVRKRTPQAEALWRHVYAHLQEPGTGMSGVLLARAAAQVTRIALIYSVMDKAREIDEPHLLAALAVWDYCEASTRHIFGELLGSAAADTILEEMRETGSLSRTDISFIFGRHYPKARINAALAELRGDGYIAETVSKTKGRSKRVFSLRCEKSEKSEKRPVATLVEQFFEKQKCEKSFGERAPGEEG
jgi:hypothetical protein